MADEAARPDVVRAAKTVLNDALTPFQPRHMLALRELGYEGTNAAVWARSLLNIAEHQDLRDIPADRLLEHYRIVVGLMAYRILNPKNDQEEAHLR